MSDEKRRRFAILRLEKIKNMRHLKARSEHNSRRDSRGVEHADPTRPPRLLAGREDAVEAWNDRTAALDIDPQKLRPDAVVGVEFLATASADFWSSATQEQRTKWEADTLRFIADQAGGEANILSAWMHEDETTPHLQVLTIPAVQKVQKKRGRPKKTGFDFREESFGWSLSAKDLVGGSKHRLADMQDGYAEAMAPLGLERGIPRKETGARNRSPAHWRAEQAQISDQAGEWADAIVEAAVQDARAIRQGAEKDAAQTEARAHEKARTIEHEAQARAAATERAARQVRDEAAAALGHLDTRRKAVDRDAMRLAAVMSAAGKAPPADLTSMVDGAKQRRGRERER